MITFVQDRETVQESEGTLFSLIQNSSPVQLFLRNAGVNTINYRFQDSDDGGTTWTDLDVTGTDLYNTLTAGQTRAIRITSTNTNVRIRANASGGSVLDFSVTRFYTRSSGAALPLLGI